MFDPKNTGEPVDPNALPKGAIYTPDSSKGKEADQVLHRHAILVQCMRDEADLQREERMQMAIDEDYYDHLQWRPEDAQVLMDRGQAPLVFNEARQSIDWMVGMHRRLRMDHKILPREQNDTKSAEIKTEVFKYVSDANLATWHETRAFKSASLSGLGWLEEGVNIDPGMPIVYTGSEDWKNVYRDSRDLSFDLKQSRYLFRRKRTDLDYAIALLPHGKQHFLQQATADADGDLRGDDVWYLGERLTGAVDVSGDVDYLPMRYRDRSAFIGGPMGRDLGRRMSLDLLEMWYRVPEAIKVFAKGPLAGKVFDPANPAHQQLERDRWAMYGSVTMRMRVMIGTEDAPVWDGVSPFRHNNFLLVPVWGYRRGRDGMCYGLMRGMRDLNDDINKRASKALHAASSNRVTIKKGAVDNLERAREEAARPDMFLEVKDLNGIRFEKPTADMQMNLELLGMDREMLRNAGGVTDANLGRDSRAVSGVAIGKVQDQGSVVTSELPDNLRLAKQLSGRLRLSHIEQWMTAKQVIRIVGDGKPVEWVTINEEQDDGTVLNDIAANEADYVIAEQDWRQSYAQAALASMMELLGQVATYAPQVVVNVLDLVVQATDVPGKDEWVARIRAMNGQRDPNREMTPEEQAAEAEKQRKAKLMDEMQMEQLRLSLEELRGKVAKLDTDAILKRVEAMFSALQAAQIVASTPGVAPVADTIAAGAGFEDQGGDDPNLPQPAVAGPAPDLAATPANPGPASPLEGVQGGIQTPTPADNGPTT